MHILSPSQLLDVWERGFSESTSVRALQLLEVAFPETSRDALTQLPIGQRNALLLDLRECLFGNRFAGLANCPACQERLDFELNLGDLRTKPWGISEPMTLTVDDYDLRFRLPDSDDLLAIGNENEIKTASQVLLQRCLIDAKHNGAEASASELPEKIIDAIADTMERTDAQANLECALRCPQCHHAWNAVFDLASILWSELNAWAARTLWQVHALASAYAWSEAEILGLTPNRRQIYLEMIGA